MLQAAARFRMNLRKLTLKLLHAFCTQHRDFQINLIQSKVTENLMRGGGGGTGCASSVQGMRLGSLSKEQIIMNEHTPDEIRGSFRK